MCSVLFRIKQLHSFSLIIKNVTMKKFLYLFVLVSFVAIQSAQAQTIEELKAQQAEKQSQVDALNGEIGALQSQIDAFPGWETGSFGTLGFNLSSFDNWFKQGNPNSSSSTIGASLNAFANYDNPDIFWRNAGNINLAWQKLVIDRNDPEEEGEYQNVADVLRISSLVGYKLSEKFALSGLLDYNTSIINNFNNPGILDIGVGATWTPVKNMVVVIHPLNYHIIMGDNPDFNSALGAKVMVDYSQEIVPGINWRTNLTSFLPYKTFEPSIFEWTWTNGFGFSVWKGIGVGIDFALRGADFEILDKTQSYFILGLSYTL
jgi:hypothetical protein